MSTRIALKYCGGCDPEFDRVELFAKIRSAAADSIEWVGFEPVSPADAASAAAGVEDDHGFNTVLVIAGCARACPAQHPEIAPYRAILLQHDRLPAAETVQALLNQGEQ
jgi:hypothetical protein